MFTTTSRLRAVLAVGVAGATLATASMASAATVTHRPGTQATVTVSRPASTDEVVDPNKVGSAGNPGYSTETCEALAKDINNLDSEGVKNVTSGDVGLGIAQLNVESDEYEELTSNCFVMD